MNISLLKLYDAELTNHEIIDSFEQRKALVALESVYQHFSSFSFAINYRGLLFYKNIIHLYYQWQKKRQYVPGVYIYGPVGRGKTWIMDFFNKNLTYKRKKRIHFNHFMKNIHEQLQQYTGIANPMEQVVQSLKLSIDLLLLDEFYISDIGDAMLMAELLKSLEKNHITLITTSNCHPQALYQNGLQRKRFIPAIQWIIDYNQVVFLDHEIDYRLQQHKKNYRYFFKSSCSIKQHNWASQQFNLSSNQCNYSKKSIHLLDRMIPVYGCFQKTLWIDCNVLCSAPRSQNDYIELSKQFKKIILEQVPQFNEELDDQAKRFILLIDELYDQRIVLRLSSSVELEQLYIGNKLAFEFKRTISRLHQMLSSDYFK